MLGDSLRTSVLIGSSAAAMAVLVASVVGLTPAGASDQPTGTKPMGRVVAQQTLPASDGWASTNAKNGAPKIVLMGVKSTPMWTTAGNTQIRKIHIVR